MALFTSTHAALTFAYNFNGTNVVTAMIGAPPAGTGKGLGGLDGAGEAGNIKRIVCDRGIKDEMLVVAKFAPHIIPRSLGKGWYTSLAWTTAIRYLASLVEQDCFNGRGEDNYRMEVIAKAFERNRNSIEDIGNKFSIPKSTVYRHLRAVKRSLIGLRIGRKGMLQVAMEEIEVELRKAGIVGEDE